MQPVWPSLTSLAPSPVDAVDAHPGLAAILRRLGVSLWVACVVPAALFYLTLVTVGVTAAIVAALVWSYGAIVWRWVTERPMSGLLALTVTVLTIRSIFTLSTGNTFVYFLQPVISDGLVAVLFLVSLASARPLVARLAADFYPMSAGVADLPRVRRLFWRLTLLWGGVCLLKGMVGYLLLTSLSVANFVLIKSSAMIAMTAAAVAVTVWASATVLRRERMLAPA